MSRRLTVILIVLVSACLLAFLGVRFYLSEHLYIAEESDEDLIAMLFDVDFPGYRSFTTLESQGEGIRRIPRHILLEVETAGVPDPVTCQAEIYFDVGDPMVLGLQWHTLPCVGQHTMMHLLQDAMGFGLQEGDCHYQSIVDTLALWLRQGVIEPNEIRQPEFRIQVAALAEDAAYIGSIPRRDGGLFDTSDVALHDLAAGEQGHMNYVLRCDGTLDAYRTRRRGDVYEAAQLQPGDLLLPETLEPGIAEFPIPTPTAWSLLEGPLAEVPGVPEESCTGWTCAASGVVLVDDMPLAGAQVTLQQTSYCSPTSGLHTSESNDLGQFEFDLYLHDTDLLTFQILKDNDDGVTFQVHGMDCLSCSCFPLEFKLGT